MQSNEFKRLFSFLSLKLYHFLPVLFWIFVAAAFDEIGAALLTLITALIHEGGHLVYLLFRSKPSLSIKGDLSGFRIRCRSRLTYKDEILLCAFGPLANLLFAAFALLLPSSDTEYTSLFVFLNIAAALSNILPVKGYDGYRILRCLMLSSGRFESLTFVLDGVSFAIVTVMTFSSLYVMDKLDGGYWIWGVFSVILYQTVKDRLKSAFFED